MKKILPIIVILLMTYCLDVNATYYENLNIETNFQSDINFDEVPQVDVIFCAQIPSYIITDIDRDDCAIVNFTAELTKDNYYSYAVSGITIDKGDVIYTSVKGDNLGRYNTTYQLTNITENTGKLTVLVQKNQINNEPLSEDIKNKIENQINNYYNENTNSNGNNSHSHYTTTVNSSNKTKENSKKNNFIRTIIIIIISIVLALGIIFIIVKVKNSNK